MSNEDDNEITNQSLRFWLQIITLVCALLTTLITTAGGIALAYLGSQHAATTQGEIKKAAATLEGKVDDAATKAEVAAVKAESSDKTSLHTNAALNEWKASYTKAPEDEAAAKLARDRLEKLGEPMPTPAGVK